jgi:hypothetical protein
VAPSSASAIVFAGMSDLRVDSANSQDTRITNAGLRNSDGWMFTPASTIQRRAPFTSAPTTSVANVKASATRNTANDRRRIWRGVRNDTAMMTSSVGARYIACRFTK